MFFIFRLLFAAIPCLYLWALVVEAPWHSLLSKGVVQNVNFALVLIVPFAFFFRFFFSKMRMGKFLIFCDTLEHEFSHIVVGFLHFKTPGELKVSEQGEGHITLNNISTFICLAPYIFPLGALTLYLIQPLFIETVREILSYIIAFFLGNYLFRLKREIHTGQSDFDLAGRPLSYLIILSTNLSWILSLILIWLKVSNFGSILENTYHYYLNFIRL